MNTNRHPAPSPQPHNRITVAQYSAILDALRELPVEDDWRDEIPADMLTPLPLIPAQPNHIPF
ncbi:MAG: hypothetical protein QG599_1078 [Pseudomonadota bacterium]|nr:hypothetical protein [Pseudomonadota bacterium]